MTCLSSRISGTVVREICPRWKFFRLLATARLMAQRYWEVFDIPIAEMDEPIWQTKLPPQLSDWCKLARCTNYQFSTIMWEKLTHPTTHSRTSQVAHRIVCSPMLMIGWTNHFCGQCQNVAHILRDKLRKEHSLAKDFSQFVSYLVLYEDVGYPQKIRHLGTKCCT